MQRPDRAQLYWDLVDLESQIEADHLVRVVWAFVERLDLDELYAAIRARDDQPGRPAADPRLLLALWVYATADGVGSARLLEHLCRSHAAYRWLCGGVPVNYHGLSDFRGAHGDLLDRILTESVSSLAAAGVISLEEVTVDGTKLVANAAKRSFRDAASLAAIEAASRERVERLRAELTSDPAAGSRRRRAAAERGAREVAARASAAQAKLRALQAEKEARAKTHPQEEAGKADPEVSTTDPQARLMAMPQGGYRPAYNLILAVDGEQSVVLGLRLTDRRNDAGLAEPMVEDLEARYRVRPQRLLVDTGLATHAEIVALAEHPERPTRVFAPLPPERAASPGTLRTRAWRRRHEPPALQRWRTEMAGAEARRICRRRQRIETVNAILKNRGLGRLRLRGLAKARCEALLHAIAHNLKRAWVSQWVTA